MENLTNEDEAIKYWNKRFEKDGNVGWGSIKSRSWFKQKQKAVQYVLNQERKNVKTILDICCGDMGFISELPEFKNNSFKYIGFESSKIIYDQIRSEFPKKTILHGKPSTLIKTDINKSCDVIICFDFLFHIIEDDLYEKILKWMFHRGVKYVILSYAKTDKKQVKSERGHYIPRNFKKFIKSMKYWWDIVYEDTCEERDDLKIAIFKSKKRPIGDIESYSKLKNHYFSERLGIGGYMIHEIETIPYLSDCFSVLEPEDEIRLIIELGSFHGGLTLQLSDYFPNAMIHTFDFFIESGMQRIISILNDSVNIKFHHENVLDGENKTLINLLQRSERKLLYCDDGNKPDEVNMYAKYLKPNDFIAVHDWNVEIKMNQIKKTIENFKPVFHNEMEKDGLLTRVWRRGKR